METGLEKTSLGCCLLLGRLMTPRPFGDDQSAIGTLGLSELYTCYQPLSSVCQRAVIMLAYTHSERKTTTCYYATCDREAAIRRYLNIIYEQAEQTRQVIYAHTISPYRGIRKLPIWRSARTDGICWSTRLD
jgi:hypothetical protein